MLQRLILYCVALTFPLAGCGDGPAGPADGTASVSVSFSTASGSAASAVSADGPLFSMAALDVIGTNGTLSLDGVWFIVDELELERTEVDCDDAPDEDACEEFEAPRRFVDLPLEGGAALTVSETVPLGAYEELEFEIEDGEVDDDEDDATEIAALLAEIRALHADWPAGASMLVTGSFTPAGGASVGFRVFFEAEVEIELDFDPPLVVEGDGTVTVVVDPSLWFTSPDGSVVDLSGFDFATTGTLVELEVEMENGFTEIEFED
ncbi:MAG: hypothetical protein ACE5FP_09915 [Gemmatimonadota bacterium]